MLKKQANLLSILLLMNFIQISMSMQQVEVFKMFSYTDGENIVGSKVSSFNLVSQHYSQDVFRKVALIHFNELSVDNLVSLILKRPFGILVILPQDSKPIEELKMMHNLINAIKGKFSKLIVYFAWDNETIMEVYNGQGKELTFNVKQTEPSLIKSLQLEDFYGYLQEIKTQNQLPTILLIASYDSFIPSAEFKLGFNSYKSGAYALLNIMKFLKDQTQYYSNLQYNVMFYLTSSKHNDFQLVNNWLNRPENQKYTGAIQYTIYLDNMALGNKIYLKKNPDYEIPLDIQTKFESTAQIYDIQLEIQEQFVNENPRTIFTSLSTDHDSIKTQIKPILDSKINQESLNKNIQFISEALLKIIYNINFQFKIIDDNQFKHENLHFQQNAYDFLNSFSFYPTNIQKNSYINKQLIKFFTQNSQNVNTILNSSSQIQFYSSAPSKMTITEKVSAFFDVYIFMGILSYMMIVNQSLGFLFDN